MNLEYQNIRVLMVGVGGIGCEVLKMITKFHFEEFHIIDMDTIEVSNLNRQFLFKKEHRGQSKAQVAQTTMLKMAPNLKVIAHFAAINTPGYTLKFFAQFDAVIMALDNAEARSYVNKVCKALGILILDAGSMGFKGQSNVYYPTFSECYDCYPISTNQKQYPACTIRSQPTTCTHCVIWAKYLFQQFFTNPLSEDESAILEVDKNQSPNQVFQKFFQQDVKYPLVLTDYTEINKINPQQKYSEEQLQGLWFYSFNQLQGKVIEFDKDDPLHVIFIYSATLLRCLCFQLEPFDYHKIKTVAGNIIHAIASTNSIVAAIEITKLFRYMLKPPTIFQSLQGATYISTGKRERIMTVLSQRRNPDCNSCFGCQAIGEMDMTQTTVLQLVSEIKVFLNVEQINLVCQARIVWDDEEEEMCESMSEKKIEQILNKELDNRIVVKDLNEKMLLILWGLHEKEIMGIRISKSQTNNKLKLAQEIKDIRRVRVKQPQKREIREESELPRKEIQSVNLDSPVQKEDRIDIIID